MTDKEKQPIGSIGWRDLTVQNAEGLRDFYEAVVGWQVEDTPMGDYSDYTMKDANGEAVSGVCHALGTNADIPPQWLMYVVVEDLDKSLEEVKARGGEIAAPTRGLAGGKMAVIRDPAGAVIALWQE